MGKEPEEGRRAPSCYGGHAEDPGSETIRADKEEMGAGAEGANPMPVVGKPTIFNKAEHCAEHCHSLLTL